MIYPTHKGKTYAVTCSEPCVITNGTGQVLCSAQPGKQTTFVATGGSIDVDSVTAEITDVTFSTTGTGGSGVTFDSVPTSASGNAVTSGGLYNILYAKNVGLGLNATKSSESVAIGWTASTVGAGGVAIGTSAKAGQQAVGVGYNANANMCNHGIAVGYGAKVSSTNYTMAIGCSAEATKSSGQAFGYSAKLKNAGCTLIGTWESDARTVQTLLYIIAAGSELATKYEGGEACLGYVVKETGGNVLACGTRKLSELLTSNTAFAPATMDLDADPPTPFLPSGVMDSVEFES